MQRSYTALPYCTNFFVSIHTDMLRHSSAAELSLMDFYNYLTITLAVGLASYGLAHVVLLLCRRFTERAYSTLEKQGPAVEEFDEDDGEEGKMFNCRCIYTVANQYRNR